MIQLTDSEKNLIKASKDSLQKNDLKRFYARLSNYAYSLEEIGHISQFLLENNINVFDYFTAIPSRMFYGAEIESLQIPDNIERIGKQAFTNCANLSVVDLGNSVKMIDEEAFSSCRKLKRVFLPDSLTVLGKNIFRDCADELVLIANKRQGISKLRCKQEEQPWYRKHLFVNDENTEE